MNDFRSGAGNVDDDLRELTNREFLRVSKVYRSDNPVAGFHQPNQTFDEIVHVAERTRLPAVAVDRDVVVSQCLNDKIRYHAAVVGVHARPVCIEDSRHLYAQLVLAVVIEEQSFSTALALVIAGAWADGVHVAPIVFCLRVNRGISIYLGGGGLQDLGLHAFGETQHVDGAMDAGLGRLHRVELVVNRRRRASEIIDLVDFDIERKAHIVSNKLESGIQHETGHIRPRRREEVVRAEDLVPAAQQLLTQMGAYESSPSCDKNSAIAKHLCASLVSRVI